MTEPLHEAIRLELGLPLAGIDAANASKGGDVFRDGRVRWVNEVARNGVLAVAGRNGIDGSDDIIGSLYPQRAAESIEGVAQALRSLQLHAMVRGSHGRSYM